MLSVVPLGARVIIEVIQPREKTLSGIHIPEEARKNKKPSTGTVVAVGKGAIREDGVFREVELKCGDVVLFPQYTGVEIAVDEKPFVMFNEEDILGIVLPKEAEQAPIEDSTGDPELSA